MNIAKQIYRTLVPESIRLQLYLKKIKQIEEIKKQAVLTYYKENPSLDPEINEALHYLKKNEITPLPYSFFNNYLNKSIEVLFDQDKKLSYVMHGTNRLYFKRSWKPEGIVNSYRMLLAEQDPSSPHRYLTKNYSINPNSVVVDVGAAEGIFALSEMDHIEHLYMIETDPEWIEALMATYLPWVDKVTIIAKFVSNKDDAQNVKLDTYFANHDKIDFLKIDVDGAEQELLYGAADVIKHKIQKAVICTYHNRDDNRDFTTYFQKENFKLHNSEKYLLFYHDQNFDPPYFRRGLLKVEK